MQSKSDELESLIKGALRIEADAIAAIPLSNPFVAVTELIYERCRNGGGKLILCGVGKAGALASVLATTFSSTGTPAAFLHPLEAVHGDVGVLQPKDILFLISNSGETREILELVPLCKGLVPDLPVICMTGKEGSSLTQLANIVLFTGAPKEICPLGMTPTTSTTVMGVMGDILVVLQMAKIGFAHEDYLKRHHGGYLGMVARSKVSNK
jgi:arabinose-5-phosphate isomerase